jgi:hypothetical protein
MHETDTPASGEDVLTTQRHPSGADEVAPHYRAAYGPAVTIPPVIPLPPDSPVGPKARAALARVLVLEEAEYRSLRERWQNLARSPSLDTVIREMEHGPDKPAGPFYGLNNNGEPIDSVLYAAVMADDVSIRHLVRGLNGLDRHLFPPHISDDHAAGRAIHAKMSGRHDIRSILQLFDKDPPRNLLWYLLDVNTHGFDADLWVRHPQVYWPYIAENLDTLSDLLLGYSQQAQHIALRMLGVLPALPARFLDAVIAFGVGRSVTLRAPAHALVAPHPEARPLIEEHLLARNADARRAAADWLAERGEAAAIPALNHALGTEKRPVVAASMLVALHRLGVPIDHHLHPDALTREAKAAMARVSKPPSWLRADVLPPLRWHDGTAVNPVVPHWWAVLACALKQPGGAVLLDLSVARLAPESVEALARFALSVFLHDQPGQKNVGLLALAKHLSPAALAEAVTAAFNTPSMDLSRRLAMLKCLAGNASLPALHAMVSVSARAKDKRIKDTARALTDTVAKTLGITADALADRMVPSCGLEAKGTLTLPVDGRTYTAHLSPALKLELRNPEGRPIKTLPSDPVGAKARGQLSRARTELRQVLALQPLRLRDAMQCERRWTTSEWRSVLLQHPILSRLAQRLVWLGYDDDGHPVTAFRTLDDLSLVDDQGDRVDLASVTNIGLAHHALIPASQTDRWRHHLTEFGVEPLFSQFGPAVDTLDAALRQSHALTDREGYMMDGLVLRDEALRRGFRRGQSCMGPWFETYERRHDGAGVCVVLTFSGNHLPEENLRVALHDLSFTDTGNTAQPKLQLADVPPILLHEAWADSHAIAAAGDGFDPHWEDKAGSQ